MMAQATRENVMDDDYGAVRSFLRHYLAEQDPIVLALDRIAADGARLDWLELNAESLDQLTSGEWQAWKGERGNYPAGRGVRAAIDKAIAAEERGKRG